MTTKCFNVSLIVVVFIGFLLFSCSNKRNTNISNNDSLIVKTNEILFPQMNFEVKSGTKKEFKPGETLQVSITAKDTVAYDSVQVSYNNELISNANKLPVELNLKNPENKPGKRVLKVVIYKNGNNKVQEEVYRFLSDIEPKIYSYQVVKSYPHERTAYTQGLVYEDGYFYESNGIKGESTLRKVQIGTGQPIQTFTLAPEIFAEGLTIFNDKIIQLSWQNQLGFVYDKKTFRLLNQFSYTNEGWGLTNDGKNLIMSDGTENIYYLDPHSYTEISRLEVYDNKGMVRELNELEYINGEIWANIYRTDKIARIDPETGKVLAYIDLSKLLNSSDYESDTDVLNGIAYDNASKRLFVTGKKWPKLFEIKLK